MCALNSPHQLPLFPLNTVLFPGMVLPLHIFEPRYKLMIGQCITQNAPFGVVLIRRGLEVGEPAEPYEVGTSAYIRKVHQLSDGRINIECVGYKRFRIQEVVAATPYMVGAIEMIPPVDADAPNVPDLTRTLRALLPRYFGLLSRATGNPLPSDPIPTQGDALAYWTAIVASLDNVDKQSLLEYTSLSNLLGAEIALIRKETMLLNSLMYVDSHNHDDTPGFSPN
jgi:hypothetical protein